MGLIDFLKKLIGDSSSQKEIQIKEPEKISFDEIENWVKNKREEVEKKEKEIFVLIKNKILETNNDLDEKFDVLDKFDLSEKKVEDKVKFLVKEGKDKYMESVKDLLEKLSKLEEEDFEKVTMKIKQIFLEFDKKSYMSYQKATFLIGKEMAALKNTIVNLPKYLEGLFQENKDLVNSSKGISIVQSKLIQLNELKKTLEDFGERIKNLDTKISSRDEVNKKVLKQIEEIKESKDYLENLKKQEEIKLTEKELEKEIYQLKEMIDFKALGHIFHVNKKQMALIQFHKEDFQTAFQEDNGENILKFLNEANLNNDSIKNKIEQIKNNKQKIIENKKEIREDGTFNLSAELRRIKSEIEHLNNEKIKDEKAQEKLKLSKEEAINTIKKELIGLNVEII
jgi:hypothetical protein